MDPASYWGQTAYEPPMDLNRGNSCWEWRLGGFWPGKKNAKRKKWVETSYVIPKNGFGRFKGKKCMIVFFLFIFGCFCLDSIL